MKETVWVGRGEEGGEHFLQFHSSTPSLWLCLFGSEGN